jgi:hypothetical protein
VWCDEKFGKYGSVFSFPFENHHFHAVGNPGLISRDKILEFHHLHPEKPPPPDYFSNKQRLQSMGSMKDQEKQRDDRLTTCSQPTARCCKCLEVLVKKNEDSIIDDSLMYGLGQYICPR